MTPRSTTLRTEGCRRLEKGVEQAPEQSWKPRPRRNSPEQPLGWRWGWKKALGWEQWNTRSAEEGQTIAQPQHLYNPVSAPLPLQACQWRDREPPERVRKENGTHFLKPEGPEEGAHPPHPYEAPTTIRTQEEEERFPDGLPFRKEEPAGEPQKGSQPQDTEWKLQVYQD